MAQLKEGSTVGGQEIAVLAHLKGGSTINGNLIATKSDVDGGKDLIGGAITDVDNSVVIPTDPSFQQLADGIGQISTGKKWAKGEIKSDMNSMITVDGLDFKPSIILTTVLGSSSHLSIYYEKFSKTHQMKIAYLTTLFNVELSSYNGYVADGGFSISGAGNALSNVVWTAIE